MLKFVDRWVPDRYLKDDELLRKSRLVVEACMLVMVLTVCYIAFYLTIGYWVGAGICAYGFAVGLFVMLNFRQKGNFNFSGNFFCGCAVIFFGLLAYTTYGLRTMVAAWMLMIPLSAFLIAGIRSGILWAVATLGLIVLLWGLELYGIEFESHFEERNFVYLNPIALIGLVIYLSLNSLNNEIGKDRVRNNLVLAKQEIERKNDEITRINRQLEDMVAQRTRNLQIANDELDTFLYESSHALRRPLVRVMGLLSLVKSELGDRTPGDYMSLVDYTVENMDLMLQALMVVSEVYNRRPQPEPVDLEAELKPLLEKHRGSGVRFEIALNLPPDWKSDATLLCILLDKLIENAVFYRREEEAVHRVRVSARPEGGQLILEVYDNGTGINPAALEDLFRMFARGTERSRGSGLGLFIVKKIVDRLDGHVRVESQPGVFTKVEVSLPLDPGPRGG